MSKGDLPALSLWQPYASLVVTGTKRHETRGWSPGSLTGRRIAVHAALRAPKRAEIDMLHPLVCMCFGEMWYRDLPRGVFVGTVEVESASKVVDYPDDGLNELVQLEDGYVFQDDYLGDYSVGRWVWRLKEPRQFAEPVPARGHQRVWIWRGA